MYAAVSPLHATVQYHIDSILLLGRVYYSYI